jgi:hypothetical protein
LQFNDNKNGLHAALDFGKGDVIRPMIVAVKKLNPVGPLVMKTSMGSTIDVVMYRFGGASCYGY